MTSNPEKRANGIATLIRQHQRIMAALLVTLCWSAAIWLWTPRGYGWPFWLWLAALAGFVACFPGGLRRGPRLAPATAWMFAALLLLGLALRLPYLATIPPNIAADEILPGYEAMQIAAGNYPNVFSSLGWFTIPGFTFLPPALLMQVVPSPFYALRLSSMLTGLVGLCFTFLLARRLFNDRVALISMFLMAVGFWHIHNSRTGFPFIQTSTVVSLVLYLLVRARQDRSLRCMALVGVSIGLGLECYFPARALLLLVPMFLLVGWIGRRDPLSRVLIEAAVIVVGAGLVLAPLLLSIDVSEALLRSQSVLLVRPAVAGELARVYRVQGTLAIAWRNFHEAAAMLTEWADVCILNRSPHGLFDAITLVAMVVGVLIAIGQARLDALLLVAWAALIFFLGVAMTDAPRASYRLAPAMPAFVMLAAFAFERTLLAQPPPYRWYRATVLPAVLLGMAAWVTLQNYQMFFVDYSGRGDGRLFQVPAAWRFIREHCDGRSFYFLASPDPTGSEPMVDIFCPQHEAIAIERVPHAIDESKPATFIVMAWQRPALERLRQCYPDAKVDERRASDQRFLFTSVEVGKAAVSQGMRLCREPAAMLHLEIPESRGGGPDLPVPVPVRPGSAAPPPAAAGR